MKLENTIGWCDATANAVIGCRGCELMAKGPDGKPRCYAANDTPARVQRFRGIETFGPGSSRVTVKKFEPELRRLNKLCVCDKCAEAFPVERLQGDFKNCSKETHAPLVGFPCNGKLRRIRVFVDSNSDWMDWPVHILARSLDVMRQCPNLDLIASTKWPELWHERIMAAAQYADLKPELSETAHWLYWWLDVNSGKPPANLILLTSVLSPKSERRIGHLLNIPEVRHGLSCEPLDDAVRIPDEQLSRLSWIIVGADSSPARAGWEHYEANARSIIEQCRAAGVPVFHKQMPIDGRLTSDLTQFPADLQVREFYHPRGRSVNLG